MLDQEGVIIIENVDICTKLRVARSYFQGQNAKTQVSRVEDTIDQDTDQVIQYNLISDKVQSHDRQHSNVQMYLQLTQAYHLIIQELAGA